MAGFSFDATAGASQSTTKPRLAGNDIYTVKYEGSEIQDYQGKVDPTKTYRVLKMKFGNEDGVYEHTIFEPTEKDFVRQNSEFTKNGKTEKIEQPSGVESMMLFFKHIIDAFYPTLAEAIDRKEKSITAPDWDKLRKLIITTMEPAIGNESGIKLVKNKNSRDAQFPGYFAGLTKDGKAYIRNNFAGKKLAFTAYEATAMKQAATAKPSNIDDAFAAEPKSDNIDLDFNL